MNMKKLLAVFLTIFAVVCCKEPNQEGNEQKPGVNAELALTSAAEFNVPCTGGSFTVSFTCNTTWKVTSLDSWVSVSPETGNASEKPIDVSVTCDVNNSLTSRNGIIYIFVGDLTKTVAIQQDGNPMYGAEEELKSGSTVLATNPNVEKFLTEVTYPDRDWSYTKVLDYYGGYNGKTYNENGVEDPNGKMFTWTNTPKSDIPMRYSIRWNPSDIESGDMKLVLADKYNWTAEYTVKAGSFYVNISNLVPNDHYTYRVTAASGKVLTEGSFDTTGSLHQVFFYGPSPVSLNNYDWGCRNGRDLGGWKGLDGKTIKYRLLYRGGRMEKIGSDEGAIEAKAQNIGAELDLRNSDRLTKPAVSGLEFLAPGIEQGGTYMLTKGNDNGNFTKQCFEFVVKNIREGKGVYFHCSLGRDRTGTLDILLLGLLGVPEGNIGKAYEVTYFAPTGYSVSSSEKDSNPKPVFKNTRKEWVYSEVVPYFWGFADKTTGKTFAEGVEKYLLDVAGVSQKDIDDFRSLMLE